MGYVALTTHPHGSNDSAGYKSRLEQHPATQQNKNRRHDRESRLVFNERRYIPETRSQLRKFPEYKGKKRKSINGARIELGSMDP